MIGARANSMARAQPQLTQANVLPAPIQGMDARANVSVDHPEVCLWAINLVPDEFGVRVRSGYREWQIALGSEVRTIIPYTGRSVSTGNRIFACTEDGIYDVTVVSAAPINKLMFATVDDDSGWGVWMHYVTEAAEDLIYYADGSNGLFKYDPIADTWAQATGITEVAGSSAPIDITKINFVTQHKLRIWLIEQDSGKAWYLPLRAIQGDATEFFFAQKFKHGGDLVGLYNWTVDGGLGRDDHLVAISRGGDVIPYTGEDPADILTWTSTGVFYIGTIPKGNRIADEYGGELFILSTLGVITMSDLLRGGNPNDPFRDNIGYRIARLLRQDMDTYSGVNGWDMKFITRDGKLLIDSPVRNDGTHRQYVYNLSTGGWGLWRKVPMLSSEPVDGQLMVGTADGRVLRMDVESDNVLLSGASPPEPITWFMLTSYHTLGSPGIHKRVQMIRPNFVTNTIPSFDTYAYYDFLLNEPIDSSVPPLPGDDKWDSALWDEAMWSSELGQPYFQNRGGTGIGRSIAIGITGSSFTSTFLASIDIAWDTGGIL